MKIANILKVLADKNRLRILQLLKRRKLCVCELAYVLRVTQPSISRHLKKMKVFGFVGQEQASFWTDYYLLRAVDSPRRLVLDTVFKLLNDDPVVKEDLARLKKTDRKKLCCK